jgi:hypothetical protein
MLVASLILGAVALLFVHLYRTALRENRALANYALLILLDDGVCGVQRKGLADVVKSIDAKNAGELGIKVGVAAVAVRYFFEGAAGSDRGDIVREIIEIVKEVVRRDDELPDPFDDAPGG